MLTCWNQQKIITWLLTSSIFDSMWQLKDKSLSHEIKRRALVKLPSFLKIQFKLIFGNGTGRNRFQDIKCQGITSGNSDWNVISSIGKGIEI